MSNSLEILEQALQTHWGYPSFRPNQVAIVQSIFEGNDTLAVLPTGGGKSICFQAPAMAKEGICVVVSPLIALMQDQVQQLKKKRIKVEMVVSGMGTRQADFAYNNCIYGDYKFLYVSPERLKNDIFLTRFKEMPVSMVAIDEAHCISQWGYDFRPSYLEIAQLRELQPDVPIIALTATATPKVQDDIVEKLTLQNENRFIAELKRSNLSFNVRETNDKINKVFEVSKKIKGSSIVYAGSRLKTQTIAKEIAQQGVSAIYYNAGLSKKQRERYQNAWVNNERQVMVATNAFGMGIDKPDVRVVTHFDVPDNLEAYYQEAGRAGRDGKNSIALLLYNNKDVARLEQSIEEKYPSKQVLKNILMGLFSFYKISFGEGVGRPYPFSLKHFSKRYSLKASLVHNAIQSLCKIGWLELNEAYYAPSKFRFIIPNEDLYRFQVNSPKYEKITKFLLRNYPGVFEIGVSIKETEIAKQLELTTEEVKEQLKYLHKRRFGNYNPTSEFPLLFFLKERPSGDIYYINTEELDFLKQRHQERVKATINYITNTTQCRSAVIQEYFGETNPEACGVCDICINNKKKKVTVDKELEQKVLKALDQPKGFEDLRQELNCSAIELKAILKHLTQEEVIIQQKEFWQKI